MTYENFILMACEAVKRGDVAFVIRLADQYKAPEFTGIREILNKITLRMIEREQGVAA